MTDTLRVLGPTELIRPHGGYLVDRTGSRPDNVDSLEQIPLTSRELSDLDMLASGALSPLEGFMGRDDYERVLEEMRLAKGIPWALPVCLAVDHEPQGDEVIPLETLRLGLRADTLIDPTQLGHVDGAGI